MQEAIGSDNLLGVPGAMEDVGFVSQDEKAPSEASPRSSALGEWSAAQSGLVNPDQITTLFAEPSEMTSDGDDDEAVRATSGKEPSGPIQPAPSWRQASGSMKGADRDYVGKHILGKAMEDLRKKQDLAQSQLKTETQRRQTIQDLRDARDQPSLRERSLDDLMHDSRYRHIVQTVADPAFEESKDMAARLVLASIYTNSRSRLHTEMTSLRGELSNLLDGKPNRFLEKKADFFEGLGVQGALRTRLHADWTSVQLGLSYEIRESSLKQKAERGSAYSRTA